LLRETIHHFIFDPDVEERSGDTVQFRLIYDGRLPAASVSDTRSTVKHAIRKALHPQLDELWSFHPALERIARHTDEQVGAVFSGDAFARCGYRFVPLICNAFGLTCSLDILFLRRDMPGGLIRSGGDIDNRLKVLFDALRVPQNCSELAGATPEPHEANRFFCLLEDDALITELRVTTDWLLTPRADGESVNDVRLIIQVKTVLTMEPVL
jgi:hypothetical protein